MDYLTLGNIFSGLASSGAWGCFDEFNRLYPEVLSVCAVQFKAITDGLRANMATIIIEGAEIALDPVLGAFTTMNPGYLGRAELPEALKALFRPMTVMVPDMALICENMLMAEGFTEAKLLASKFYGLYSLLMMLLSAQLHYDWGLRAVKSVLVVAGSMKRASPDVPEDHTLMRALRDFNNPKIVAEDRVVFFGLLGDLFPGINPPRVRDPEFEAKIEGACETLHLFPHPEFVLKVTQWEELLSVRHSNFLMGASGAGKSEVFRALAIAQTAMGKKTKFVDINPKSITTKELYGFITMATREWRDGVLSKVMRDLGNIPDEFPKWLVLDGDLDANWIESMNSVMDDNKMLTLASNERIPLKNHMKMIFEIRDLRFASPATVSRAGILYIATEDGYQWRCIIKAWLHSLMDSADDEKPEHPEVKALIQELFDKYQDVAMLEIAKFFNHVVYTESITMVQSTINMLKSMLPLMDLSELKGTKKKPEAGEEDEEDADIEQ
jgi:dynein heavy chain